MFPICFLYVSSEAQKFNLRSNTRWPHIPYVPHSLPLPRLHLLLLPTPPFLASRTIHKTIQKIIGLPPPTSSNFLQQFPISPNFSKFFPTLTNFHLNFFYKKFPNFYKSITFSISPINNHFYILLGPLTGYIPNIY